MPARLSAAELLMGQKETADERGHRRACLDERCVIRFLEVFFVLELGSGEMAGVNCSETVEVDSE